MLLQSCMIALVGMGTVFGFLLLLVVTTNLLAKMVRSFSQSDSSEIVAAIAFARHQKGE